MLKSKYSNKPTKLTKRLTATSDFPSLSEGPYKTKYNTTLGNSRNDQKHFATNTLNTKLIKHTALTVVNKFNAHSIDHLRTSTNTLFVDIGKSNKVSRSKILMHKDFLSLVEKTKLYKDDNLTQSVIDYQQQITDLIKLKQTLETKKEEKKINIKKKVNFKHLTVRKISNSVGVDRKIQIQISKVKNNRKLLGVEDYQNQLVDQ